MKVIFVTAPVNNKVSTFIKNQKKSLENLKGDPTKLGLQELIDNASPMIGVKQCQGGVFAAP
jgi:hypothetical protein